MYFWLSYLLEVYKGLGFMYVGDEWFMLYYE